MTYTKNCAYGETKYIRLRPIVFDLHLAKLSTIIGDTYSSNANENQTWTIVLVDIYNALLDGAIK